ncbi:MAG: dienelactone hydrolase family protein [Defluviicoccus sp.]|nr:dienelactone hydrolase family protein [Defluviicoccus sp.]MDE0384014.1 dienelactone hydrolase family protein [Defluviicoccus sp.]
MAEQVYLTVDGSRMECLVAAPRESGIHPALVIAPHLPADRGLKADAFTDGVADRYARAGYVCAVPQVFHRQPVERERPEKRRHMHDDEVMMDLSAARDFLAARDDVDRGRIGVLGHCTGGRMAILAATRDGDYRAAIDFWGGGVNAPWGAGMKAPLDGVADIRCPVAGFFGNEDPSPSPQEVDELEAALRHHGKICEFHRYDGAGHAFQNFANPERFRANASEDAWTRAIDFLDRHLKA